MNALKAIQLVAGSILGLFLVIMGFALFGVWPTLIVSWTLLAIVGVWLNRRLQGTWWTTPFNQQKRN